MARRRVLATVWVFLLICGAATASKPDDTRALWAAARSGDAKSVANLLERGVDVNARDEIGISALWLAASKGHLEVIGVVLKHRADPNSRDNIWYETPLSMATGAGNVALVRALLQAGVQGTDRALMDAAALDRKEVVQLLVDNCKPAAEVLGAALLMAPAEAKEVRDLLKKAGAKPPTPIPAETRDAWTVFTGTFENENGGKFIVEFRDGVLLGRPTYGTPYILKNSKTDVFQPVGRPELTLSFERAGKQVPRLIVRRYTSEISYYRLDAAAAPKAVAEIIEPGIVRVAAQQNWPSFRGPQASGIADGQQPPIRWNTDKGVNVRWKTPIPGLGHSCPIIWTDRVFVTTAVSGNPDPKVRTGNYGDVDSVNDTTSHRWQVFCLDRNSGKVIWERTACEGVPKVKRHLKGSQANCTPATDGKHVVACFASEGLYCYDFQGKLLWRRGLDLLDANFKVADEFQWGFGSSPILYAGLVILQCDLAHDSFIAAYSLEDGRQVWSTPRDEIASWTTPTIWLNSKRIELVTNASQYARGYDPATGKELWRLAKKSEATIPTPVPAGDLVYLTSGNRPIQPIFALRPGALGDISLKEGEDTSPHIAWSRLRGGPYMTTPIIYDGYLYTCSNNGMLTCYEARSGKQVYKQRMGGVSYTASPVAADGRLYFTSEQGEVRVVKAGPRFELLAVNAMGDVCMASPAISAGALFVRSQHFLFALGNNESGK
jgi:outer membrane protein assembly factor BamB